MPAIESKITNSRFLLMAFMVLSAMFVSGAHATAEVETKALSLVWQVTKISVDRDSGRESTQAELRLTNNSGKPLPRSGWSLYFTCVSGIVPGDEGGTYSAEQVTGTLYRLRPGPQFKEVGAGETAIFRLKHADVMNRPDKAPQGPYLAYDAAPETAVRIPAYELVAQLPESTVLPGDLLPEVSATEIFAANEGIIDLAMDTLPPVFPTPLHVERRPGSLRIDRLPTLSGPSELRNEIDYAKRLFAAHDNTHSAAMPAVPLRLGLAAVPGQASPEAYQLTIDPGSGIALSGNTAAGVFRGLQSLRQLLPAERKSGSGFELPALHIVDAPRFAFRGLMVDVARNFQRKETVMRLIDLAARYKLNKLHFHLTDDEGWRLAIKGLPELTSYGAQRGHTLDESAHLSPAHGSGPDLTDEHGSGYYTAADFIEIVRYAAKRHIEVIPEIEMPGHARAAVKAMEARTRALKKQGNPHAADYLLSDPLDQSSYRSAQLHSDNVINPGLPSTYRFIDHVIAEVVALYKAARVPLRTIHVGGDELAEGAWEKSPATQALMKKHQLASTVDVWDYFYDQVDGILRKHGVQASGWEELGARKTQLRGKPKLIPNPAFTRHNFDLFVWNNLDGAEDLANRLANAGYKIVMAPATRFYFDMAHNRDPRERGVNWAAYTDLDKIYDFVPFDSLRKSATDTTPRLGLDGLTDYGKGNVLGLEGTLFSEVMRTPQQIDFLLMPRLLGLAERAWAADPAWAGIGDETEAAGLHQAAWSAFANQLGKQVLPRLDVEWPDLNYRIPPPGLKRVGDDVLVNHQLPGFALRYTTDGSVPSATSPLANGPIRTSATVTAAAFDSRGRTSRTSQLSGLPH